MPCVTKLSAVSGVSFAAITVLRRGDCGLRRRNPHIAQRLCLGASDLVLGELHAPLEMLCIELRVSAASSSASFLARLVMASTSLAASPCLRL